MMERRTAGMVGSGESIVHESVASDMPTGIDCVGSGRER
jgi:hypothetical protein